MEAICMKFQQRLFLIILTLLPVPYLWAQEAKPGIDAYPTKSIKIIVPFPAGGTSDVLARLIGQKLAIAWGQTVVVDNKPGASGNLGADLVAKATPDGYTLALMDVGNLTISQSLYAGLPFNVAQDFAPIVLLAYSPHLLVVSQKIQAKSVAELIAFAKANPGKLNFASAGTGSAPHLAGIVFAKNAGIDWTHIPYKGGAQALADLAAGQVDVTLNGMLATYPFVKSGSIKLLALSSDKRLPELPDTPLVSDTMPGFLTGSWQGILAPAGTPQAIQEKLFAEISRISASPEVKNALKAAGADLVLMGPEPFKKWLITEVHNWSEVVRANNVKPD
jgi:tripartite-type tricarboxylate transporter receptor subunit TctC